MTVFLQHGRRAPLKTTAAAASADAALTSARRSGICCLVGRPTGRPARTILLQARTTAAAEARDENRHCTANVATRLSMLQLLSLCVNIVGKK